MRTLYSERASSHDLSSAESSHCSADESGFCLFSIAVIEDLFDDNNRDVLVEDRSALEFSSYRIPVSRYVFTLEVLKYSIIPYERMIHKRRVI